MHASKSCTYLLTPIVLREKPLPLSIQLLFVTHQMFESQQLEITVANYIQSQCAMNCLQDFTKEGKMILKLIGLKLEITEQEVLRTWFCLSIKN